MEPGAIKDNILLATLPHVVFDGWSMRALQAGVAEAGYTPDMALRAFPGGMAEVAEHFSDYADRRMMTDLEKRDLGSLKVSERIATAIRARLKPLTPHREAVRRMLSFLALPTNAWTAARCTYRTVNAVWYAAGDEATDFSFYTKRGLLAPVYTATVLYWLGDTSEGSADTWAFLQRRIADVMQVPRMQARLKKTLAGLPGPFRAFYQAARSRGSDRFGG